MKDNKELELLNVVEYSKSMKWKYSSKEQILQKY